MVVTVHFALDTHFFFAVLARMHTYLPTALPSRLLSSADVGELQPQGAYLICPWICPLDRVRTWQLCRLRTIDLLLYDDFLLLYDDLAVANHRSIEV